MEKQSIHFNFIIYPEKHNGTVLLAYETHPEQLEQKRDLDQTTTVNLGTLRGIWSREKPKMHHFCTDYYHISFKGTYLHREAT